MKLSTLAAVALIVIADPDIAALAQVAAPVTQNTDTTISVGTLAGQALTWVATVFGVPVGSLLTAWLYRLFRKAGVDMTDAMRARLQEMVVNGINIGANRALTDLKGRGSVEIKNIAVGHAVAYVQEHGAEELKAIGIDPYSNVAVDAIKARIETAIADANAPTNKILDPAPAPTPGQTFSRDH